MLGGPKAARVAATLCTLAWTSPVSAAPIELVSQQDGFMLFDDVDGSVQSNNFFAREPFLAIYGDIEAGFLAVHPDDSQFLVVYTTWQLPPPVGALYQAVANDVNGIGYEHAADFDAIIPETIFDDTPNSQVQGFMHMNRWTQYLGGDPGGVDDTLISQIFGQELGHAWLAFVHIVHPTLPEDALLGRSEAHWSFYAHSSGSPVEGHDWTDNGDGTFTATRRTLFEYSDLDLYLMGLIPAEQVEPWFVLTDVSNCVDSSLPDGECAPANAHLFAADSYTVTATRNDVTIEDVIAAEGVRSPAVGQAPTSYDVSFLVIKRPDESLSSADLAQIAQIVERSIEIFNQQTRGLAQVVNRTAGEAPPGGTSGGNGGGNTSGGAASSAGSAGGIPTTASGTDTDTGFPSPLANEDTGCACQTQPARPWRTGWLLLLVAALCHRRREPGV